MVYLQCLVGFFFVALVCVKNCYAISCYECNSATDKRCLGDENNKLTDDLRSPCPDRPDKPYSLCRKIKQIIDFEVNGLLPDSRIIRSCGYENSSYNNRCYQRSGFGGRQEVCACDKDDCNSGTAILASISLIFSALIVVKLNV